MLMSTKSAILNYTISDVSSYTGRRQQATNFIVFKNNEMSRNNPIHNQPLRCDHFVVYLVLDGTAYVKVNQVDYHLSKNSFFIIPHNAVHQFQEVFEGCSIIVMGFKLQFLIDAVMHLKNVEEFDFITSQIIPHLILTDREVGTLLTVMELLRQSERSELEHIYRNEIIYHGFNVFMFEISAILKKYRKSDHFKTTRKENLLMIFFKLLTHNFKVERSVRYYADQMFVSSKHLTKIMKELTNKTCGQIINDMVISEAKILLHDLSMSVKNVADTLHFSDQFFFSKFFKHHTGLTPSEYKINY